MGAPGSDGVPANRSCTEYPTAEELQVDAFVDALRLYKIGFSWAGPVSLAVPYDLSMIRPKDAVKGTLVRFSIGLEAVDDLIADAEQALGALAR